MPDIGEEAGFPLMTDLPPELFKQFHFSRYYRVWKNNPDSILFVPLAEICRESGYLKQAEEICQSGLQHHPQSVSGRLTLARIYRELGEKEGVENRQAVLSLLEGILRDYPGHQEALQLLRELDPGRSLKEEPVWETCTFARILADQGEKKRAIEILKKILHRDPSNQRALEMMEGF